MAEANRLGKRKPEDDLETEPVLKKPKENPEEKDTTKERIKGSVEVELSETMSDQAKFNMINIFDSIDFFKDVGQVVRVLRFVDCRCNHEGKGLVEFASANEAKKALETKNGEYLYQRQLSIDAANKGAPYILPKYCLDCKVCIKFFKDVAKPVSVRLIVNDEGKHAGFAFVEFASATQAKKFFMTNICILHIYSIGFFKDVGQVVHVRLIVEPSGKHLGYGFVEFASVEEAKKALETKNGEYLLDRKIFLDVVDFPHPPKPKFCLDHKVGVNRFRNVGKAVRVRLIVDHCGASMGCGFVEFASADEAKKAVQEKNGLAMYVNMAEIASPYPFRPKYNLYKLAKKLWYEDYLRQEVIGLKITLKLKEHKKQHEHHLRRVSFCGNKITFSNDNDDD
ncbi:unnamed protein product [Thlaspi arvense]|uniref:RRM domain-containing protein n=1 Tax=Thlaspi arvense TaxID=13288 RepID=A0AAU9SI60_THLAR|nr:unnamed protein product [Thlaspi arvense]